MFVVFTHIDKLKKEQREEFRRKMKGWLGYNSQRWGGGRWSTGVGVGGGFSLINSLSNTVTSLQGEDITVTYNQPPSSSSASSATATNQAQAAFDLQQLSGETVPLMPLVLGCYFVNCLSGDGVGSLKKALLRVASGSSEACSSFSGLQAIGQEIPNTYSQVEQLIRELRYMYICVYVCVCVCTYVHSCTLIYSHITYVCAHTHNTTRTHTRTRTRTHAHTHITHIYMYTHIHSHTCTYVRTHTHSHTHTHTHTHTLTYKEELPQDSQGRGAEGVLHTHRAHVHSS